MNFLFYYNILWKYWENKKSVSTFKQVSSGDLKEKRLLPLKLHLIYFLIYLFLLMLSWNNRENYSDNTFSFGGFQTSLIAV